MASEVEHLLALVRDAVSASSLPEQPDAEAAEALVLRAYRQQVVDDPT